MGPKWLNLQNQSIIRYEKKKDLVGYIFISVGNHDILLGEHWQKPC